MDKQLYRSRKNKVLAGVCGGIAEYFRVDPVIIRILWLITAMAGVGVFIYIISAFLIPERPRMDFDDDYASQKDYGFGVDPQRNKLFIGGGLVLLGVLFILKEIFRWFDINAFWPIALIVVGLIVIYSGRRGSF